MIYVVGYVDKKNGYVRVDCLQESDYNGHVGYESVSVDLKLSDFEKIRDFASPSDRDFTLFCLKDSSVKHHYYNGKYFNTLTV